MDTNNKTKSIIALIVLILILVFIALFVAIKATLIEEKEPIDTMINPIAEMSGIEDVRTVLSFFYAPTTIPQDFTLTKAYIISNVVGDIRYTNANGDQIMYRMALLEHNNIDGDYNEYKQINSVIIGNTLTAKLEGNDDLIYKATWKDENYTYALLINNGLDKTSVIDIIKSTIKTPTTDIK